MDKLTKNEFRFSHCVRPEVGAVVEFLPVKFLLIPSLGEANDVVIVLMREATNPSWSYMVYGAKCKVIGNSEFTTEVVFLDDESNNFEHMVSPSWLVTRELTESAIKALEALKDKLTTF